MSRFGSETLPQFVVLLIKRLEMRDHRVQRRPLREIHEVISVVLHVPLGELIGHFFLLSAPALHLFGQVLLAPPMKQCAVFSVLPKPRVCRERRSGLCRCCRVDPETPTAA
jgi:hypothetical protein